MAFVCSELGCDKKAIAGGLCVRHYKMEFDRKEREGEIPLSPPLEKGEARTEVEAVEEREHCPDCGHKLTVNGKCMPCIAKANRAKKKAAGMDAEKASPSPQSPPVEGGEVKGAHRVGVVVGAAADIGTTLKNYEQVPDSSADNCVEITIDLSGHPEVYRRLAEQAAEELRTVEMQALWLLGLVMEGKML